MAGISQEPAHNYLLSSLTRARTSTRILLCFESLSSQNLTDCDGHFESPAWHNLESTKKVGSVKGCVDRVAWRQICEGSS